MCEDRLITDPEQMKRTQCDYCGFHYARFALQDGPYGGLICNTCLINGPDKPKFFKRIYWIIRRNLPW